MRKLAQLLLLLSLTSPAWATTYYLSPAAGGGSDSNSGTSASAPWLTPNHAVNCGDVIIAAASTSYQAANFGSWGTVSCSAGNNVAWLKCATFDACKINASVTYAVMYINASYWGVQGWEVTASGSGGACFTTQPRTSSANIHHVVFANDIANGCTQGGFNATNNGLASVDYVAYVGNIAYNTSGGSGSCTSGLNIYQPVQADTVAGTHIYIAGNVSWGNVDGDPCDGGAPTDGEGIILDSLNGAQGGLPNPYAAQVVVQNNIAFLNGGAGIEVGGSGNPSAIVVIKNNTVYGNNGDHNRNYLGCGDIAVNDASLVQESYNLVATNSVTGCGTNPIFALSLSNGDNTDQILNNFAYGISGQNTFSYNNGAFAFASTNVLGTNPQFSSPVNPGAPNCGSASSVPNCMATVIANFAPKTAAAAGYGYQTPSTAQAYDPLFPQWLCNVNLPTGLVTIGCLAAPLAPPPAPIDLSATVN